MLFYININYQSEDNLIDLVKRNKIVHVKNCSGDLAEIFFNTAKKLNASTIPNDEDLASGNKNGNLLIDISYDENKSTYFRHSNTAQPFHTDTAYNDSGANLVFLYCDTQTDLGGETIFLDSIDLLYKLKKFDVNLFYDVHQKLIRFEKGTSHKFKSIVSYDNYGPLLTWNYFRANTNNQNQDLIENFKYFLESIKEEDIFSLKLLPSEFLIFHDERLLHGRKDFKGNRVLFKGGLKFNF